MLSQYKVKMQLEHKIYIVVTVIKAYVEDPMYNYDFYMEFQSEIGIR